MDIYLLIVSGLSALWGTIWAIYCYYQEGTNMEWWQSLLVALASAIAGAVVAGVFSIAKSRKSQIKENTKKIEELIDRIGIQNDKTLCVDISDKFGCIVSDIGREGESSLTKQHQELKKQNEDILIAINSYRDEETKKLEKFSKKQKNIKETLNEVKMFFEDWESTNQKYSDLEAEYAKLEKKYSELEDENQELREQLAISQSQYSQLEEDFEQSQSEGVVQII